MGSTCLQGQIRKSDLPAECRSFVEDMQRLNFGRYENVPIRDGLPRLDPKPRRIRSLRPGRDNRPRSEAHLDDFVLKEQQADFFRLLDEVGNGVILVLEIKDGMPCHMTVEEGAA